MAGVDDADDLRDAGRMLARRGAADEGARGRRQRLAYREATGSRRPWRGTFRPAADPERIRTLAEKYLRGALDHHQHHPDP
jgi:hypothetical protein